MATFAGTTNMSNDRYLHALYCDDVRFETGNKPSYMGIYSQQMLLETIPLAIPKFCVVATAACSKRQPFKSLKFRLLMDEIVLQEQDVDAAALAQMAAAPDNDTPMNLGRTPVLAVTVMMILTPFVVERPSLLRIVAVTEEEELFGAALKLMKAVSPEQLSGYLSPT
jgi:hypothetical protein